MSPFLMMVLKTTQATLLFFMYCLLALAASGERYPFGPLWTLAIFLSVMVLLLIEEILSGEPIPNGVLRIF